MGDFVSTIERAAERLAKVGRTRVPAPLDRTDPAVDEPMEQALTEHVLTAQVITDQVPSEKPQSLTQSFVGGGYHEIDLEALAEQEYVTPGNTRSRLALDFRRIKRPLLINARRRANDDEHPANLIVVTSSVPGEGKTFVSINLAMSISAELDLRVLLVDADSARSSVSAVLGLQYDVGLSEVLARGGDHLEDSIFKTNIEHLSVLPSGSDLPNGDELFASDLMRRLAHDLAAEDPNRIVIFDAPPLLAGTEAGVLTRMVGQVVVVVEADSTPQSTLTEALSQLDQSERVSLVLNKVKRRASDRSSYGYGYGYGHDA